MKHIAVLLPGLVREYSKLDNINKMREFGEHNDISFYFFGVTYNFSGNTKNHWFTDKDVSANIPLDEVRLNEFCLDKLEIQNDIIQKDRDGYDGRIYAQWKLIYDAFASAENYSKKMNIEFDLIFRSRWDIDIHTDRLSELFDIAINDQKLCVIKYRTITDQSFVGPPELMKRAVSLYDVFYEYLELPIFVEKTNKHKYEMEQKVNSVYHARHNHCSLRFAPQSEIMLTYHLNHAFDYKSEVKNMGHRRKWWKLRNIR